MPGLTERPLRRRQPLAPPRDDIAHPVLRRVLAHRGLGAQGLDHALSDLLPWSGLKGITAAAEQLHQALEAGSRILIVGDYDADGATGVALAISALRDFGAERVDYLVPDRVRYGYGLSAPLAELALQRRPELVITVDNGISSIDGIARLHDAGVPVVVTDHHLPGEALPAAAAIVNPNQPGDGFASKALAGVGVMFYLLLALRQRRHDAGHSVPNMAQYLDLVALGTVADLVPLDTNNRILVEQGLRRMRAGLARPGIQALVDVSRRVPAELQASDLGFALGPRVNAAGRLEHMDRGIACLLAPDISAARPLAAELDEINRSRRALQGEMQEMALDQVLTAVDPAQSSALCLYDKRWHEGVVGLVASRLKEQFHRPALAFARAADGSLKGSGRSIPGFHLRDALALLDARHPGLIAKFGGHAMAAGLSIAARDFERLEQAFAAICAERIRSELLQPQWSSDGELAAEDFTADTVLALRGGGPWGQAWEEPQFDNAFAVLEERIVGSGHLKLKLSLPGDRRPIDAIAFGVDEPLGRPQARLVYQLQLDDYYAPPRPQLIVRGLVQESALA